MAEERRRGLRGGRGLGDLRVVVLGWSLWLLGSWSLSLTVSSTVPAVRWMVFSALLGLMGVWPAYRLSEWPGGRGVVRGGGGVGPPTLEGVGFGGEGGVARRVLTVGEARRDVGLIWMDWLLLVGVLQAVIWPLRLIAQWQGRQAVWIALSLMGWAALTGLVIVLGRRVWGGLGRTVAMGLALGLVLGEPAVVLVLRSLGVSAGAVGLSPLPVLWELTRPGAAVGGAVGAGPQVVSLVVAAGLGWVWVAVGVWRRGRGGVGDGATEVALPGG